MARTSPVMLLKFKRPIDARQAIWECLRSFPDVGLTTAIIADNARVNIRTVLGYLNDLEIGGYVSRQVSNTLEVDRWRLVRDVGLRHPRVRKDGSLVEMGQGRQSAWTGIRIMKRFTTRELHLNTGIALADAKSYCQYLAKAGYLRVVEKGGPAKLATYLLDPRRDTGPLAPQVTRIRAVFDQNTEKVVWPTEKTEAEIRVEGARP